MKRMRFFSVAVFVYLGVVLLSCASVQPAPPREADNTTAKVYFFMPNSGVTVTASGGLNLGTQFSVWDSETFLTYIGGWQYVALNFEAGTHFFMAVGESWHIMQAELTAGKTYFYKLNTIPGFRNPNVALEPLDPNDPEIENYLEKCKEIQPKGKIAAGMVNQATQKLNDAKSKGQIEVVPADKGK